MATDQPGQLMYADLASWWPLVSPPEHYAEEANYLAGVIGSAPMPVHEVLELGSGGGHNAVHLKQHFAMTLVDLSEQMLDVSRRLNPDCEHQPGDMCTVRLGRTFDAVFVHDAITYMTSERDLRQAIETAFVHCRPGGIAVFVPDEIAETFAPGSDHGGSDSSDGSGVRYLEWTWDPDPTDTWVLTEYAFLLRNADGSVDSFHETHRTGLFSRRTWLELLSSAGFEPASLTEVTADERTPREIYVAQRPLWNG